MAEKPSQLEEIKAIDTDSTEDLAVSGRSLETRGNDDSLIGGDLTDYTESVDDDSSIEAEQIREQIVETRRGMSETIDAIQEKLSFANISEQVKDQVSGQIGSAMETAKDAFLDKTADVVNSVGRSFRQIGKSEFGKKVQENPTALALMGAGIGALLVSALVTGNKRSRQDDYSYDYVDYEYDYDSYDSDDDVRYADFSRHELNESYSDKSTYSSSKGNASDTTSGAYETFTDATDSAYKGISSAASSTYDTVGSAASTTYEGVSSIAGKTYEGASNLAGKTYQGVGNLANKTYEVVGSAADYTYLKAGDLGGQMKVNYNHYIEENPLAVGAVALAVGAAIGFAVPLTSKENELMGEYRDNVVEKAQATAQEAIGTVKQMASDAQKVISEEVKSKTA